MCYQAHYILLLEIRSLLLTRLTPLLPIINLELLYKPNQKDV